MEALITYFYNATRNSRIERGSEIMYFDEYSYEEIENDRNKEDELIKMAVDNLHRKYGYFSIKVTSIDPL